MSDSMFEQHILLKNFLRKNLYSHDQKQEMTQKVQIIINELFQAYMEDEEKMPLQFFKAATNTNQFNKARIVADYIAGMTDRYAIAAHEALSA